MLNLFYLGTLIILPVLIPIILIIWLLGEGKWDKQRYIKALTLNSDKGLSSQGLLWLSILCPVCYFLFIGSIIWSGYEISISEEGLSKFLSISTLPLTLLSLAIPFSVLVSRFHATKQTAEQIKITRIKNNIDLFNSHRNELFSYFNQIDEMNYFGVITGKYKVRPRLHKIFFMGKPAQGVPYVNPESFRNIETELSSARFHLHMILSSSPNDSNSVNSAYSVYILNFCSCIYRLSEMLGLPEIYDTLAEKSTLVPITTGSGDKLEILTVGSRTLEAVSAYRYAKGFYDNLCDFAGVSSMLPDENHLKYIDVGDKFLEAEGKSIIEYLHATKINEATGSCTHPQ